MIVCALLYFKQLTQFKTSTQNLDPFALTDKMHNFDYKSELVLRKQTCMWEHCGPVVGGFDAGTTGPGLTCSRPQN